MTHAPASSQDRETPADREPGAFAAEPPTDPLDAPAPPSDGRFADDSTPVAVARDLAPLPADALDDEVPEEPTLDVAPERVVAEQAQRTDVALAQWRAESERRAAEFRARSEVETAALGEKRRKLGLGMALGASAAVVVLAIGAGVVNAGRVVVEPAPPPARLARAPRAAPAKVAPAKPLAPVIAAATPVATAPVQAPPVIEKAPRVAAPAPAPVAAPAPVERGPAVRDGVVKVQHGFVFTEFRTPETENVKIWWRDGAHGAPLDPMGCGGARVDGLRTCKAGRSVTRIESALAAGAQPGQWTVEACVGAACTPVGSFAVPFAD